MVEFLAFDRLPTARRNNTFKIANFDALVLENKLVVRQ